MDWFLYDRDHRHEKVKVLSNVMVKSDEILSKQWNF